MSLCRSRLGVAVLLSFVLGSLGAACGGESSDGGSGGTSSGGAGGSGGSAGLCVADASATTSSCQISWELKQGCSPAIVTVGLEAAIFDGGCPADSVLASGDTSTAVMRATFTDSEQIPTLAGFTAKTYGFAIVGRSAGCLVQSFGCTEADLSNIKGIITAICDWSDTSSGACLCQPLSGGQCPVTETCSAGVCSGA